MADHDDLDRTADGIRDRISRYKSTPPEVKAIRVQSTMQEETAIALHRVAEAVEDLTEAVESLDEQRD